MNGVGCENKNIGVFAFTSASGPFLSYHAGYACIKR
jgi:hypothetical protein